MADVAMRSGHESYAVQLQVEITIFSFRANLRGSPFDQTALHL